MVPGPEKARQHRQLVYIRSKRGVVSGLTDVGCISNYIITNVLHTTKTRRTGLKSTVLVINDKKIPNKHTMRITYFFTVQSLIQYVIIAWSGCNTTLIMSLAVAQKNSIEIILVKPKTYPSI